MNVHEYQAKAILAGYGVPVPKGGVAFSAQEAVECARGLSEGGPWVVKAQIHAGGRGKSGGVKIAGTLEEVRSFAGSLLGSALITHQTGPGGQVVRRIYVEAACDIDRELYLSMLVDRANGCVAIVASTEGGVDIETVAAKAPGKVATVLVKDDIRGGLCAFHQARVAKALGFALSSPQGKRAMTLVGQLYEAFLAKDFSLLEINPLVVSKGGDVVCLDAKASFDDNALFLHEDVRSLRDPDEEDPAEVEASKHDLNYVRLDGSIACMVNGAGLAMATMDVIKVHGGEPANFLDVGGSATKDRVAAAFRIILSDPRVKGVLINIFGGIMRCDVVAGGVVEAAREVSLRVPLVVRLEGTNVDLGRRILAESGLSVVSAPDLDAAAREIVKVVKGVG